MNSMATQGEYLEQLVGATIRYAELRQEVTEKARPYWRAVMHIFMEDYDFTRKEFDSLSYEADENIRRFNTELNEMGIL